MILKKIYDEKTRTQKVWYDSSMIVYSEMVEDENENVGDLYVVFKNGTKYRYLRVKFEDYVVLSLVVPMRHRGKPSIRLSRANMTMKRLVTLT